MRPAGKKLGVIFFVGHERGGEKKKRVQGGLAKLKVLGIDAGKGGGASPHV